MANLDFPSAPTLNETYTASGKTWTWDGSVWTTEAFYLTTLAIGATVQAWDANLDTWATKTAPAGAHKCRRRPPSRDSMLGIS